MKLFKYYSVIGFPEAHKPGKDTGRKYKTLAGATRRAKELSKTMAEAMVRLEDHDEDYPETIYSSSPVSRWVAGEPAKIGW